MKKLLLLCSLSMLTLVLRAQSDYFLFIQSENNQPYYVQTDGKTLSSSAIGHLIISGLKDSLYIVNIGFPKNQFPEQVFQVRINKKDAGYQLKNMGSDGWALFNMQTLQLIKAQPVESKKQVVSYGDVKKTDNFSTLMAGLVNDSAVLYTSIAKAEPVKENSKASISDAPVSTTEIVKKENLPSPDSSLVTTEIAKQPEKAPARDSGITNSVVKQEEVQKKDTPTSKTDIARKEEVFRKDTTLSNAEIAKQDKILAKDTIVTKTETVRPEEISKKDTRVDTSVAVLPAPADTETEKATDSLINTENTLAPTKAKDSKPLIVWFSETKTSAGTELVYFDMSSADKIDTIKMLILNDEMSAKDVNRKEEEKNTGDVKDENTKSGVGKFFGKIFGKKNSSKQQGNKKDGKDEASKNVSSIKVTTVEKNKPVDSSVAINNTSKKKEDLGAEEARTVKDNEKQTGDQKTGSGKFFGKLFGRKNNSARSKDDTSKVASSKNLSTIKVTTVENPKPKDPPVEKTKEEKNKVEVVTKENDRSKSEEKKDGDEKTGAGKLIGKIFRKKDKPDLSKNDSVRKVEPPQKTSSIKVTAVDNGTTSPPKTQQTGKPAVTNADCRAFASENDVDKLRIKIIGVKDIDGQITESRKAFRAKCFSTSQIRALSQLFRTDEGKYRLFDAAYPYVSDTANFKELSSVLTDEYYINRFKAMVRI